MFNHDRTVAFAPRKHNGLTKARKAETGRGHPDSLLRSFDRYMDNAWSLARCVHRAVDARVDTNLNRDADDLTASIMKRAFDLKGLAKVDSMKGQLTLSSSGMNPIVNSVDGLFKEIVGVGRHRASLGRQQSVTDDEPDKEASA